MTAALLDERSEPSVRRLIGGTLSRCGTADFAVSRIRLDGIDLSAPELAGVRRCRVLLGRLDVETLADAGAREAGDARRRDGLDTLRRFLASGRLEVRAAGLLTWSPDFSVFRELADGPTPALALVGAHYFARPYSTIGLAFTCVLTARSAVARVAERFEELWSRGYDVAGVLHAALAERIPRHEPDA